LEGSAVAHELPFDKQFLLERLMQSTALFKLKEDRRNEVTSADAWLFWDITQTTTGQAVDQRLKLVEGLVLELEVALGRDQVNLRNGRPVTEGDVRILASLHRFMADRFAQHLNILRNLADPPKQ
jgi:hypothetical protein